MELQDTEALFHNTVWAGLVKYCRHTSRICQDRCV